MNYLTIILTSIPKILTFSTNTKWFQDPLFHNSDYGVFCVIVIPAPVKTTLFHFNESHNDRILNDVREYVDNFTLSV